MVPLATESQCEFSDSKLLYKEEWIHTWIGPVISTWVPAGYGMTILWYPEDKETTLQKSRCEMGNKIATGTSHSDILRSR